MVNTGTKTIRQHATLKATPYAVYEMLMDSKLHAAFSGGAASVSRKVGGKFTAYDGYIEGKNLELVPDKKIVQAWRGSDWPKGHYSEVTFTFIAVKGGTKIDFLQTNVPTSQYEDISEGWKEFYWQPMKVWLAERA